MFASLDVGCLVFGGGVVRASVLALGYCLSFVGFCCLSCPALCFRLSCSGAQWPATVANFGVYVDGNGGPGFFPRDVLPWSGPFTVQIFMEDRVLADFTVDGSVFLPRPARFGPLRAFPYGWGKVLYCFVMIRLDLVFVFLVNSNGALHLVPYAVMSSVTFCIKAKKNSQ